MEPVLFAAAGVRANSLARRLRSIARTAASSDFKPASALRNSSSTRHARHIWLEDADASTRTLVPETWARESWEASSRVQFEGVEAGYLQLSDAWDNINAPFGVRLVLCNGGFLVSEAAFGVLPHMAVGFVAEITAKPGALTILMNREGFQHDERWIALLPESPNIIEPR